MALHRGVRGHGGHAFRSIIFLDWATHLNILDIDGASLRNNAIFLAFVVGIGIIVYLAEGLHAAEIYAFVWVALIAIGYYLLLGKPTAG